MLDTLWRNKPSAGPQHFCGGIPMKTVYDLLGIRPDASTEAVKKAFHAAVKLHHPDHHPGEPDAPFRFRQIAAAYAILRDAKRRGLMTDGWRSNVNGFGRSGCTSSFPERSMASSA